MKNQTKFTELSTKNTQKTSKQRGWINKQDFMKIHGVANKTVDRWLEQCNDEFVAANTKKGGYHNLEVFFSDTLVKKLQWIAEKNMLKQGSRAGQSKENFNPDLQVSNQIAVENTTIQDNALEQLEIGAAANAVMHSADVKAAEEFAALLISRTKALAEVKHLKQQVIQQKFTISRLENDNEAKQKRIEIDEGQLNFLQHRRLPSYVAGQLRCE